jgi:hypothetical protein
LSEDRIAYFISPHGFGHATRASAIMAALGQLRPTTRFDIFTRVPRWLFEQSLGEPFGYHEVLTDVGLAQQDSLHEDIAETVRRLDALLPFRDAFVNDLAGQVKRLGCRLVVCDIAPLGLAVARAAGLPGVLVENFTWDWIYGSYVDDDARLRPHIDYLRGIFDSAVHRIQTEPVCVYRPAQLVTAPVSRAPRAPAAEVRAGLGVPAGAPLALITMGGLSTADEHAFLHQLAAHPDTWFVIPGANPLETPARNVVCLPAHSSFYHPDILNAADAVIGKSGYSTVAEAYHAGIPYGYVSRPRFPESDVMAKFIQSRMRGIEFTEPQFQSGAWLERLADLLALGRIPRADTADANGAGQAAQFITSLL